jgi:hypothetical protein
VQNFTIWQQERKKERKKEIIIIIKNNPCREVCTKAFNF